MRDNYLKIVDEINVKEKTKRLIKKQIELFYDYKEEKSNKEIIGGEVILKK